MKYPQRGGNAPGTRVSTNAGDGTDVRLTAGRTAAEVRPRAWTRGRTDARIIWSRARARTPASRCQRSQLPLFQDFYNWGEAVGRINAPTGDRAGQLFNGIVITRSPGIYTWALPRALSLPFRAPLLSPSFVRCVRAFPIFVVRSFLLSPLRSLHSPFSVSLFFSWYVHLVSASLRSFVSSAVPVALRRY